MNAPTTQNLRAASERIARHVIAENKTEGFYPLELALEGMLALSAATGDGTWAGHVQSVIERRGWKSDVPIRWRGEPFVSLAFAWADYRHDSAALAAYVAETRHEVAAIWRSSDGLMLHPRGEIRGGGYAVLIDSFAEYISRTARAAKISGDEGLARECADQLRRHRAVLRDPRTGLWSQGRGWLADRGALSPGAWSRGHGWLMRGFLSALEALPRGSEAYQAVQGAFREMAEALLPLQDEAGLWHALLHRRREESGVETSGTGLIAGALLRGVAGGHLPEEPYLAAGRRAVEELCKHVDENGVVHDACPGPGPLEEEGPWMTAKFPPGDHHGAGTVLNGLTAGLLSIG